MCYSAIYGHILRIKRFVWKSTDFEIWFESFYVELTKRHSLKFFLNYVKLCIQFWRVYITPRVASIKISTNRIPKQSKLIYVEKLHNFLFSQSKFSFYGNPTNISQSKSIELIVGLLGPSEIFEISWNFFKISQFSAKAFHHKT